MLRGLILQQPALRSNRTFDTAYLENTSELKRLSERGFHCGTRLSHLRLSSFLKIGATMPSSFAAPRADIW